MLWVVCGSLLGRFEYRNDCRRSFDKKSKSLLGWSFMSNAFILHNTIISKLFVEDNSSIRIAVRYLVILQVFIEVADNYAHIYKIRERECGSQK